MALFALLIIGIIILVGFYTVAIFVFRIMDRPKQRKALTDDQQATNARLLELDALRSANLISESEHEERRKQIMDEFVSRTQRPSR